mmetsp:Transcript_21182/g.60276  ORF Transcript_21182/g.60276 Transcript_21182/m.60276 type:complete len:213 (-) Transcript_21182:193-831(-)
MADEEHPLESAWSFWEHRKGGSTNDYGAKMHRLGDFQTVEDFWRFKNNLPRPSEVFYTNTTGMKKLADREIDGFSMFKAGIRPEWEDPANMTGGEFFCRQLMAPQALDDTWEKLLLGLIGETIDPANEVCGARIVDKSRGARATYRIEMWFRGREKETLDILRSKLAVCLGSNILKEYMEHNVAMSHHGGGGGGGGGHSHGGKRGGSSRNLR